jgi:predicted nucleotidyltransferase
METLATKLERIADRYGVRDVYVFGSRAGEIAGRLTGGAGALSSSGADLDIAVQPAVERDLSARQRVRLIGELEDLFGVPRVDLVVLSEAPPVLAVEIVRGELIHTSDGLAQAEHELYILRRAADLAPHQSERLVQILTAGAR